MPSVEFNVTGGSPRIVRASNVPAFSAFTWCGWYKITSYQDWGELFALLGATGADYCYFEANSAGSLDLVRRNGSGGSFAASNFWSDSYAGWAFLAVTSDGTTLRPYVMREADLGTLTALTTLTTNTYTTTHIGVGAYDLNATPGGDGNFRVAGLKCYDRALTSGELLTEAGSLAPVSTSNLSWANDCQSASTVQVDESGTDGDFTKTGTPTDNADEPDLGSSIVELAGTTAGTTTPTGNLQGNAALSATAAGTCAPTGSLVGRAALSGTAAGTCAPTASLMAAANLSGTSAGTCAPTADLRGSAALAGATACTASPTGNVQGNAALSATTAGTGAATGDLQVDVTVAELAGTIAGTSSVSGDAVGRASLSGATSGAATPTGTLAAYVSLSGSTSGSSSPTARLDVATSLSGSSAGSATTAAVLQSLAELAGQAPGLAAVIGLLIGGARLGATASGTGSATGNLTASSPVLFTSLAGSIALGATPTSRISS